MSDDHKPKPPRAAYDTPETGPEDPRPAAQAAPDSAREDDDYKVGFGRPPRHSQFKPGVSGRPGGKPGTSKKNTVSVSLDDIVEDVASMPTMVRGPGGQRQEIPLLDAVVISQFQLAAKGDPGAARNVFRLLEKKRTGRRRRMTIGEYTERVTQDLTMEERKAAEDIAAELAKYYVPPNQGSGGEEAVADDAGPELDPAAPLPHPWAGDDDEGE